MASASEFLKADETYSKDQLIHYYRRLRTNYHKIIAQKHFTQLANRQLGLHVDELEETIVNLEDTVKILKDRISDMQAIIDTLENS